MKRISYLLVLVGITAATSVHAAVSFALDAGFLRGYAATGTPAFMPTGGLLLLISNTGESLFQPASLGNYVTGDDTVISAFAMNYGGGTGEDQTTISNVPYGGSVVQNDEVALRWFPDITFAQYQSGALPVAGNHYGTYSAGASNPDGGNDWLVPADGTTVTNLDFFTTDDSPGTQAPSEGYASSVIAAVPEPASFSAIAGAIAVGAVALRRRRK